MGSDSNVGQGGWRMGCVWGSLTQGGGRWELAGRGTEAIGDLDGRTAAEDKTGGRAGQGGDGQYCCCPASDFMNYSGHQDFLNALQML